MIKTSLYFFILLFSFATFAANNYGAVIVRNPKLSFDISDSGADVTSISGAALHYEPKVPTIVGFETAIKDFTLGYSKTLSRSEANEEQAFTDYNLRYYFDSIGIDAIYSEFLGFRLTSAEQLDLNKIPQDEKFRKDFAIKASNVNLYYFPIRFNWNLNHSMDVSHSEQNTGLGFGIVTSYNNVGLDTQYGAIPTGFQSNFGSDGTLKKGSFESTSLSAAIAGTLALRPLFLSLMGTFGSGKQTQKYETTSQSRTNSGTARRNSLLGILGIAGKTFFLALQVSTESPEFILKDLALKGTHSEAALKVGFNF